MRKTEQVEAFILGRRNLGEADRLVLMFGKDTGKIWVLSRGVRKMKSRLACHLEPYTFGKYYIIEGRTFKILAGADTDIPCDVITQQLGIYKSIAYIAELLDLSLPEEESNPDLFRLTKAVTESIKNRPKDDWPIVISTFEISLLYHLGYIGSTTECSKCRRDLSSDEGVRGDLSGFYCSNCAKSGKRVEKNLLKIVKIMAEGNLEMILRIKNIESYQDKLEKLIKPKLYDILPRKPKSTDL